MLPLPIEAVRKYKSARKLQRKFFSMIYKLLQQAREENSLSAGSVGEAIMTFSDLPETTERDVLAEIEVMFIAGR